MSLDLFDFNIVVIEIFAVKKSNKPDFYCIGVVNKELVYYIFDCLGAILSSKRMFFCSLFELDGKNRRIAY